MENIIFTQDQEKDFKKFFNKNRDEITRIYDNSFGLNSPYKESGRKDYKNVEEALISALEKGGFFCFLTEGKNIIAGTGVYPLKSNIRADLRNALQEEFPDIEEIANKEKVICASDIFINPEYRGEGIGTKLTNYRYELSKALLGGTIFVTTTSGVRENIATINFQKKNGINFGKESYQFGSAFSDAPRIVGYKVL